jgi:hypothetical protein
MHSALSFIFCSSDRVLLKLCQVGLELGLRSSCLCLPRNWNYMCPTPHPAYINTVKVNNSTRKEQGEY